MDEKTIREVLGPPDQIISADEMKARVWKCWRCGTVHAFTTEVRPPATCDRGGIALR